MSINFSWLKSRKRLFISSTFDGFISLNCFYFLFRTYIINESTLIGIGSINTILWIITSYILGRYGKLSKSKLEIFIHQGYKSTINLLINIFFSQIIFRIFWNYQYMNFESFMKFTNIFSIFYLKLFTISLIVQFVLSLYLSKKSVNNLFFYFMGKENIEKYLDQKINKKYIFKIKRLNSLSLIKNNNPDGIIIEDDKEIDAKDIKLLFKINKSGIKLIEISKWCEKYLNRYPSELIKLSEVLKGVFSYDENSFNARTKRISEFILSLILITLTTPIILISALFIKLEDGGPIFYTQVRNGFQGNTFRIIKLRTMIVNAESNGIQWSKNTDKRITKVGNVLRTLRIDELPQLLLVLKGDMSLIGPRPERPYIDDFLKKEIPNYDLRYSIKPGISGWAQVNYNYGASIRDSSYKLSYDLYYIKNFSLLLDFLILFKTMRLVFNGKGSKPQST